MGVPGFFSWLLARDKKKILKESLEQKIDYLFLDTNGLIHPQCFKTLDDNGQFSNLEELENKMIVSILSYIDFIVAYVQPQKMLYIAIDGVAPMAKVKHQRARRYKSVVDSEIIKEIKKNNNVPYNKSWSNACITPGTKFMSKITKAINEHVASIQCPKVIFSSAFQPGEGEHKIMSYIRSETFLPNDSFCVYGLDADLIFLSLASSKQNIFLLREYREIDRKKTGLPFVWVCINSLRNCITKIFAERNISHDFLINDFIFLCYLLGNDFIPNIPTVNIYENGIDKLLDVYSNAYKDTSLLTVEKKNIKINISFLTEMFHLLSLEENETLRTQWKKGLRKKQPPSADKYAVEMWNYENLNFEIEDFVRLGSDHQSLWQKRYYQHYFKNAHNVPSICQNYMEGLYWIAFYYFIDCKSWKWYYKFDHAPLVSTIHFFLSKEKLRPIMFRKDQPITAMEQLLIVIPPKLSYLLPTELAALFQLQLASLTPITYSIDYVRKLKNWQGMPILPDIDLKKIHSTLTNTLKKPLSIETTSFLKEFGN